MSSSEFFLRTRCTHSSCFGTDDDSARQFEPRQCQALPILQAASVYTISPAALTFSQSPHPLASSSQQAVTQQIVKQLHIPTKTHPAKVTYVASLVGESNISYASKLSELLANSTIKCNSTLLHGLTYTVLDQAVKNLTDIWCPKASRSSSPHKRISRKQISWYSEVSRHLPPPLPTSDARPSNFATALTTVFTHYSSFTSSQPPHRSASCINLINHAGLCSNSISILYHLCCSYSLLQYNFAFTLI